MPIDFAYVQARAQARHGQRLTAPGWRTLEASRSFTQYVHAARQTSMAPHVHQLAATSTPHEIELSLRCDWLAEVAAVSTWVPRPWRASVDMTAWLPYLGPIQHLIDGGPEYAWMRDDPALAPLFSADSDAVVHGHAVLPQFERGDILAQWLSRFRAQWPYSSSLASFVETITQSMESIRSAAPASGDSRESFDELRHKTIRTLRSQARQPVTAFCHLLLVALDIHRLRDGLLRRALFNDLRAST